MAGRRAATGGYASGRLRGVSRSIGLRGCPHEPGREGDPRAARGARTTPEERARDRGGGRRPGAGLCPPLRRFRRAGQLRQRGPLRAVPLRHPQPPAGVPGDAVALHLLRGGTLAGGSSGRGRQPVGSVAGHRGRGRVGPSAGRAHPDHHQQPWIAPRPRGGPHPAAPRGRGAGRGRHQDVHLPAVCPGDAERGARGRGVPLGRALPRPRARGAGDRSQRVGGRAVSPATATRTTSSSWGAASTTRPPSRWRSR